MKPAQPALAAACDLCGSQQAETVLDLPPPCLSTDGRLRELPLRKVSCRGCGLIRSSLDLSDAGLAEHYAGYRLGAAAAAAEPLIFSAAGAEPASVSLRDWIVAGQRAAGLPDPRSVLEVGCGAGALLIRLGEQWPQVQLAGVDLDPAAVAAAQRRGLAVLGGTLEDVGAAADAIISVAVMEHVASPRRFLRQIASRLSPQGWAAVIAPVQDGGNRDVFFWDHLFHFHSGHVAALGAAAGLRLVHQAPHHPLQPGFALSLFVPEAGLRSAAAALPDAARHLSVAAIVTEWQSRFRQLDRWLAEIGTRPLTVFGLGETFDLLHGYSTLRDRPVAVGLDDNPMRARVRMPGLRVERPSPERLAAADALLVTFAPPSRLRSDLEALGVPLFHLGK